MCGASAPASFHDMKLLLAIALGGAAGALGRHFVGVAAIKLIGHGFPWSTLAVNIGGSLMIGILIEIMALSWSPSPEMRAMLTIGFLGAFTTFSTFSLDVAVLYERGEIAAAAAYAAASVFLSLGALFAGMRVMRLIL